MRAYFLILFILLSLTFSFSFDLGGALSLDFYNNPIENSAPSPIQQRPILFHSLNINIFNLRSGFGFLEGYYEVNEEGLTVFNDFYKGFYTLEFDIFTYPGVLIELTENFSLGLSVGGGVRLPVLVKIDDDIDEDINIDDAFGLFYSDLHYLYWGADIFTVIKLPMSVSTRFFANIHYKDFITRTDEWIVGATVGLLWQFTSSSS